MSNVNVEVSFSMDDDGFFRRECPNCERQFKVPGATFDRTGSFFCPYCAKEAGGESWWTPSQAEYAQGTLAKKALGPELAKLERSLKNLGKASGGLIKAELKGALPSAHKPLEPNDMRKVEVSCHPETPLKVLEDWTEPLHCFRCGESQSAA